MTPRPRPALALALLLSGCGTPPAAVPASCARMCTSAAALYGGCLSDWGADWSAAGFADEDGFVGSCETWGWEMSILEADAVERGALGEAGWLAETCAAREAAFSAEDAACSAYTDIEWDNVPWAPEDTGG